MTKVRREGQAGRAVVQKITRRATNENHDSESDKG